MFDNLSNVWMVKIKGCNRDVFTAEFVARLRNDGCEVDEGDDDDDSASDLSDDSCDDDADSVASDDSLLSGIDDE